MKRTCVLILLALVMAVVASTSVFSQQKGSQDTESEPVREAPEPIITEETMPNTVGEYDLRWNLAYGRNGDRSTGYLPGFQFFFGLSQRIGGDISIPIVFKSGGPTAYGFGDVSVSVKGLLIEEGRRRPAVVAGLEADFPTGNAAKETGEGAYQLAPFVALLKNLGRFSAQGNVGWSRKINASASTARAEYFYNWAIGTRPCGDKLYLFAEINGIAGNAEHQNPISIAPGFRYKVTEGLSFGFAIPIGLNHQTDRWGVVNQLQLGLR